MARRPAPPRFSTEHAIAPAAGFRDPVTLIAVLLGIALALGVWAAANRPVDMPGFDGRIVGLAFSPYHRGESPEAGTAPTEAEIRGDLVLAAARTDRIRTYTVAGVLGEIPRLARDDPRTRDLRITLGAWLDRDAAADARELDRLIAVARASPAVEAVVVGNEALLRHDLSPAALVSAIARVKAAVTVPVSTAEPWHVWLAHPELAEAVDVITIHLLPYWEGLPVEAALSYALDRLRAVEAAYPGKRVVIGEIGWPSDGVDIGAARAGRVNQARFLRGFLDAAAADRLDYFVMEAFDQPWKTSFEGRAAGYWGMSDLDRAAKWPMTGPVAETPGWRDWALAAALGGGLASLLLLSRRPDLRPAGKLLVAALGQGVAGTIALVLLAMSGKYLSAGATLVWIALIAAQALLVVLLLADGFELAETLWGRRWRRVPRIAPAPDAARLPRVSIHVPICNEPPEMVARTLSALARLDYPDFEVLVVDNNTTDSALWEPVARNCALLGERFRFFHLGRWPGFKAGALNFALRQTAPEAAIIGVLDSDYVVSPDWLRCMVPLFADPAIGLAQSPQDYRDGGKSPFKRLMFWEYAGFFQCGMVTRNERDAIIQHGTMTLIRRAALEGLVGRRLGRGGTRPDPWAEWCICEDAELGLSLLRAGWRSVYARESFGRGVMPDDFAAYRRQRARWAYGAMQIARAHAGALLSPFDRTLSRGQRWHFVTGWLPWLGDALGQGFLALGLLWSVGLVLAPTRTEFPIGLFMLPSIGLFGFKLAQMMALYRGRVACGRADRIGAAIAGLALSHTIGKAVWRGLLTRNAPFRRTPKLRAAPPLLSGLAMAREEAAMLALAVAAAVAVAVAHRLATPEARLWCAILLVQALPYAASVAVSLLAAAPGGRRVPVRAPARPSALAPGMGGDAMPAAIETGGGD